MITPVSSAMLAPAGSGTGRGASAATAAVQFESILLGQWLQSAESGFTSLGEDDGGEQMTSFGVQALANQFARQGGIGIAHLVEDSLAKAQSDPLTSLAGSNTSPSTTPPPSQVVQ
jgi:Rod binding domain-containing protein